MPPVAGDFPFALPLGYLDRQGRTLRDGVMRLATAGDEVAAQGDARVRQNPAYLTVLLLSRTMVRLGGLAPVTTDVIEGLFAIDLAYLTDIYYRINRYGSTECAVLCPSCGHDFTIDVAGEVGGQSWVPAEDHHATS